MTCPCCQSVNTTYTILKAVAGYEDRVVYICEDCGIMFVEVKKEVQ